MKRKILALVFVVGFLGCATSDREFQRAIKLDSISAYEDFLGHNPQRELSEKVRQRLAVIRKDEKVFQSALNLDTIEDYLDFLEKQPDNYFVPVAKERILDLDGIMIDEAVSQRKAVMSLRLQGKEILEVWLEKRIPWGIKVIIPEGYVFLFESKKWKALKEITIDLQGRGVSMARVPVIGLD